MAPSLPEQSLVIAGGWFWRLRPLDVVIVRHGGMEKIKRIKHVDGDRLYLIGDNAAHSTDSRHFGWVERTSVIGKVFWPRPHQARLLSGQNDVR